MHRALFTLIPLALACALASAATVYKWVDENGVVHYSDQPHPDAQKMKVPDAQTYKAMPADSHPGAAPAAPAEATPPPYQGCAVVQPGNDQTFTSVDSLNVVVRTDPTLRTGDRLSVTLDGQPLEGRPNALSYTISPVERGTHTVQVAVRDSGGALLCQSSGVSFHVHQNSLLNPSNPQNRAPTPH